jgi:hypothetical protein
MLSNPFYAPSKYQGIIIRGSSVDADQATEIIIRTTKWPILEVSQPDSWMNEIILPYKKGTVSSNMYGTYSISRDTSRPKIDILSNIKLFKNNKISTPFLCKSNWCEWSGEIQGEFNIGKYIEPQEIHRELFCISNAFPFLEMKIQLLNNIIDYDSMSHTYASIDAEWNISKGMLYGPFEDVKITDIKMSHKKILSRINILNIIEDFTSRKAN